MDYDLVKKAVTEAMKAEMKDFYIDREKHYQHHEFLEGLINFSKSWKSNCGKAVSNIVVGGLFLLILWGFISWGSKTFKG